MIPTDETKIMLEMINSNMTIPANTFTAEHLKDTAAYLTELLYPQLHESYNLKGVPFMKKREHSNLSFHDKQSIILSYREDNNKYCTLNKVCIKDPGYYQKGIIEEIDEAIDNNDIRTFAKIFIDNSIRYYTHLTNVAQNIDDFRTFLNSIAHLNEHGRSLTDFIINFEKPVPFITNYITNKHLLNDSRLKDWTIVSYEVWLKTIKYALVNGKLTKDIKLQKRVIHTDSTRFQDAWFSFVIKNADPSKMRDELYKQLVVGLTWKLTPKLRINSDYKWKLY